MSLAATPGATRAARFSPYQSAVGGWLLIAATVVGIWVGFEDVLRQSDFSVFLRAADQAVRGVNPYTSTSDPQLWAGKAFVYPWLAAFLFVPFAILPSDVANALFYLLNAAAIVLGCRLLGLRSAVAVCALLLASPILRNAELGAINALFFLAAAALWRWRDRTAVVATAVVFLVGTKLFLAPLLVWVVITRSRRCAAVTVGALMAFFAVGFLAGPISLSTYARSMSLLSEHEAMLGMSLRHLCALLGLPPRAVDVVPLAAAVALLAVVAVLYLRRPGRHDRTLYVACLSAGLLATPIVWTHYLVLVLFVIVLLRPSPRWVIGASAAVWVLVGPAYIRPVGGLSVIHRIELLFLVVLALPVLAARLAAEDPGTGASPR